MTAIPEWKLSAKLIRFTAQMVEAIQQGRKTQMRRPVKPQPQDWQYLQPMWGTSPDGKPHGEPYLWRVVGPDYPDCSEDDCRCPYGAPGDRLQVTFPSRTEARKLGWTAGDFGQWLDLWIEITGVRVEQLQQISEADAMVEGLNHDPCGWFVPGNAATGAPTAREAFRQLWDSIYAEQDLGWDQDPWCWVVEFRAAPRKEPAT